MNVFVTGGAGYIGTALVEKLSHSSLVEKIVVLDNLSAGNTGFFFHAQFNKAKVKFVHGDVLDTRLVQKLVKQADVVVHLASEEFKATDNATAHLQEQVNHWGTAELTYAIENAAVQKLIHLSTAEVYGLEEGLKNEESPLNPVSPYAISKQRGEAQVLRLKDKLSTTVFRPGVVLGAGNGQPGKGVANQMLLDTLTKNRITIHGNGKQSRPFCSLEYTIQALEAAITGSDLSAGIYNLVQGNNTILELVDALKILRPDVEFIFMNHHLQLPSILVESLRAAQLPPAEFDLVKAYGAMLEKASV